MEKADNVTRARENRSYFASFLARIGGIFLTPDETFSSIISDHIGFWEPFLLVLGIFIIEGAVLSSFAYRVFSAIAATMSPLNANVMPTGFLSTILVIMIFVMIAVTLIFWIIIAGIAHLSAKYLFRGEGSFSQLIKLYGYSFIPYSLTILSTVLFGLSWTTWPLSVFLNIVTVFWIVLLMTTAVKQNYKIDTGKAFISSFIGPMLVWLILVSIFWVWMLIIIRSFAGGFV